MSWDKAKAFGIIKCKKNIVNLYHTKDNYVTVTLPNDKLAKNAIWSGDALVIYLENGDIRRYSSLNNYTTV